MADSVRITKSNRELIESRVVGTRFDAKKNEIGARREALAKACYEHVFNESQRKLMDSLPVGWMHSSDDFYVRICGTSTLMKMGGGKSVRLPYRCGYHDPILDIPNTDKLAKEYYAIKDTERSVEKENDDLRREIRAVLHSVTTSTKLVKVWPEIRQIVEQVCQTTTSENLPAPRVKYLNKVLGLPPKDAKAA